MPTITWPRKRMTGITLSYSTKTRMEVNLLSLSRVTYVVEPMLFVDVNLGNSGNKRIVVYEGDTAEGLATSFSQ